MTVEVHRARSTASDPVADELLGYLETNSSSLGLDDAIVYYGFPRFRDEDDQLIVPRILILSPQHGLRLVGTVTPDRGQDPVTDARSATETVFGQLFGKLIANRALRQGARSLAFGAEAYVYAPDLSAADPDPGSEITLLRSHANIANVFRGTQPLTPALFAELTATVDGSRVIPRPRKRPITALPPSSKGALVSRLEMELALFDKKQREASLTDVHGPQRIRGLAGSGKTIVLAKKAALMHLDHPDAKIAYTFYTKSLYQQITRLITRFYRDEHDRDPDWDMVTVAHAWGGANEGIYSLACEAHGVRPLQFRVAQAADPNEPFGYACRQLMDATTIKPMYDYLFVDEGQDYPDSFLRLCALLAKEKRFIYAYDELQTIFQPTAPTPASIFGVDKSGAPRVKFERDIVLYKCYRNPLEILVCAHAIGFGVYGKMVQMLENEEHWTDIGYILSDGALMPGSHVALLRPLENSLPFLSQNQTVDQLVSAASYSSVEAEVKATADAIAGDVAQGLRPDDIMVVVVDDRNAKAYLQDIASALARHDIDSNNIHAAFGVVDFHQEGRVTLTTVHKAKGNEAYAVYVVGADAPFESPGKRNRNKLFTAMTRAKGWLSVSGVRAGALVAEIEQAKANCPFLRFVYPEAADLAIMKRDLDAEAALDQVTERLLDKLSDDQLAAYAKKRRIHRKR